MEKIKYFYFICGLFFISVANSQSVEIRGKVIVDDDDIEGIHVINKTASKFTITNSNGEFVIPAKLNDTIIFSAIKYKPKEIIINSEILKIKMLNVYLTELVNLLDEVIVGKVLTGNLLSDVENSEAKRDIDFYDLGIPGYTGKPLTQSERRYNEATTGGGIVPLNPILNYFSGRTKMLKNQIKIERLNDCLESIKSNLSQTFFEYNELDETYRVEFFYYCLEDDEFSTICQIKNDIKTLEFLKEKLQDYKENLQIKKD
ncbi:MAG: carboxypeptidase-like regulatory domain-containing protein [Gelidibacter sp.]